MSANKRLSQKEALNKAARYCAYQERSQQQVRDKLYSYGLFPDEVEETIAELITEDFLNEERFAIAYARGKFKLKHWGKIKIIEGLKQHKVSKYCINQGLKEIDDADYYQKLSSLISKKFEALNEDNPFKANQKVARYLISKGYEPTLVWDMLKN